MDALDASMYPTVHCNVRSHRPDTAVALLKYIDSFCNLKVSKLHYSQVVIKIKKMGTFNGDS